MSSTPSAPVNAVLTGAVMTHPLRADRARRLVPGSGGVLRLVTDPDPDGPPAALRTAIRAWSSVPAGSSHHLVLHDDMLLSDGFFDRVRRAIEVMPDAALALFSFWNSRNGAAVRLGALAGARWVPATNEYTPCTALVLPREVALGYAGYVNQEQARTGETWPEDVYMYRYLRWAGVPVFVAVPNLAEHEDLSSLSGNNFQGLRRSACFLDTGRETEEHTTISRLPAVPFFKYGAAQCAVPVPDTGRWLNIRCEDYLSGLGFDVEALRGQWNLDPAVAWPIFLTAYAMGVVEHNLPADPFRPRKPDTAVLDAALATIGPGGLCHSPAAPDLDPALVQLAKIAVEQGQEDAASLPPRRPAQRTVALRHADSPLGEYVARGLADRGVRVSAAATEILDLRTIQATVYGPGMARDSLVGRLLWQALVNEPLTIDDPGETVSLLHTTELIDALATGATVPAGLQVQVGELAEAIRRTVRPVPLEAGPWTPKLDAAQTAALDFGLHTAGQWLAYE
jgi:hypothetical protein